MMLTVYIHHDLHILPFFLRPKRDHMMSTT
jgi:hypothetical protein